MNVFAEPVGVGTTPLDTGQDGALFRQLLLILEKYCNLHSHLGLVSGGYFDRRERFSTKNSSWWVQQLVA